MNMGAIIKEKVEEAGFKVADENDDSVLLFFDMGKGRTQRVMLRYLGRDNLEQDIIGISSPALALNKGELLGEQTANRLLFDNSRMSHGAWALQSFEEKIYLVMLDTQILDTMQKEELISSIKAVISSADQLEKELGDDKY